MQPPRLLIRFLLSLLAPLVAAAAGAHPAAAQTPLPDLVAAQTCTPTDNIATGDTLSCTITVTNVGNDNAEFQPVRYVVGILITVDGGAAFEPTMTTTIDYACTTEVTGPNTLIGCFPKYSRNDADVILPRESRTVSFEGRVNLTRGRIVVLSIANPFDAVIESTTANNRSPFAVVNVGFPDLIVSRICTPKDIVSNGEQYSCTIAVENAGAGAAVVPAGALLVADIISAGGSGFLPLTVAADGYTCGADAQGLVTTVGCFAAVGDTIGPGQNRQFTVTGRVNQRDGTIAGLSRADPTGRVNETNRSNNTSAGVAVIVYEAPTPLQ